MRETHVTANDSARRHLLMSVCLLALVFTAVLCGLARDENWRKFLRVLIASSTYVVVLLSLTCARAKYVVPRGKYAWTRSKYAWTRSKYARARAGFGGVGSALPFWPFASAAVAAELSSGWLRTGVAPGLTIWLAPLAGILVGGVHWLALRHWRSLRARLIREGRGMSWKS